MWIPEGTREMSEGTEWRQGSHHHAGLVLRATATAVLLQAVLVLIPGCDDVSNSSQAPPSRVVTFRVRGGATAYMGTTDRWLFDGEKPLEGLTTMRVELSTDPAEIEFVAGSSLSPEHFVRCEVGTKLRTTVLWDGERLTCETR